MKVRCGRKVRFEIRFEINEWMPRAGMTQKLASKFSFKHGRLQLRNHRTDRLAGEKMARSAARFFRRHPTFSAPSQRSSAPSIPKPQTRRRPRYGRHGPELPLPQHAKLGHHLGTQPEDFQCFPQGQFRVILTQLECWVLEFPLDNLRQTFPLS